MIARAATITDDNPSTVVTWQRTRSGTELASIMLSRDLTAIATDPSAKAVAFTGPNLASPGGTVVVVATPEGEQFRHAYTSELQPEGFSNIYMDGSPIPMALFVVEYLDPPPADRTATRRYRVRVVNAALPRSCRRHGVG